MSKTHVLRANQHLSSCTQSIPPGPNGQIWPRRAGGGAEMHNQGARIKGPQFTLAPPTLKDPFLHPPRGLRMFTDTCTGENVVLSPWGGGYPFELYTI